VPTNSVWNLILSVEKCKHADCGKLLAYFKLLRITNRNSLQKKKQITKCSELSSGLYCRVKWLSTDVSEVRTASIIRDEWTSYSPPWELEISHRSLNLASSNCIRFSSFSNLIFILNMYMCVWNNNYFKNLLLLHCVELFTFIQASSITFRYILSSDNAT
jgi:hypothetical protein